MKNYALIPNKKGIFFTLMVIVIVSLLLVTYTFYSSVKERKTIQKRVETMNNFVNSMESDLPRKMFVAGFRSIFTFNTKIVDTGQYIGNVNARVEELFFNGTYLGTPENIMVGARYSDIVASLISDGAKINVNVTIKNASIKIDQTDPWNIRVTLTSNITISDANNLALWNRTFISSGFIPTYHFDDPVYLISTGGTITSKVNKTIYEPFSIQTLSSHVSDNYYVNTTYAPSFIDRLEGQLGVNSLYGVESLVNIPLLDAQGISIQDKSIVDHVYFSSSNPTSCQIAGQPNWFKLTNDPANDPGVLTRYNAVCG